MKPDLPDDVAQFISTHNLPRPDWFIGSPEGAWRGETEADWPSASDERESPAAAAEGDAPAGGAAR